MMSITISHLLSLLLLSSSLVVGIMANPKPKMVQEEATGATPSEKYAQNQRSTISSRSAIYVADSESTTFKFPIGGGDGRGVIGVSSKDVASGCTSSTSSGTILQGEDAGPISDFFAIDQSDSSAMVAMPFAYSDVDKEGGIITVSCTTSTRMVAIVRDEGSDIGSIEATVTEESDGEFWDLEHDGDATMEGQSPVSGGAPVSFSDATKRSIRVKPGKGSGKGLAMVHAKLRDSKGNVIVRTLIREAKVKPVVRRINVKCCDINEDGDVVMNFPGLGRDDQSLKVDARLGIQLDDESDPISVVDISAMLDSKNEDLVVHGGWVRLTMDGKYDANLGWEVVVMDMIVTDPEDGYRQVGRMGNVIRNRGPKRRHLLMTPPSAEEHQISDEMRQGRKPTNDARRGLRSLSGEVHKKLLVHGYCSTNPFPTNHFTSDQVFVDSGSGSNGWSHDAFARRIDSFASAQGITGCGCIAHSQGGAACLHLYSRYWSCLDYTDYGSRLIQSIGTPYQGTRLAGSIAAIGEIFGAGCGVVNDLTQSGAPSWLSSIPSWARSKVYYRTTSFEDKWWRYDYCHLASDLFLDDPDDGTTEKGRGQLSGGNNLGHNEGLCHTKSMRDPAQYEDSGINSEFNSNAAY